MTTFVTPKSLVKRLIITVALLCVWAAPSPAQQGLLPGIYQFQDQATCELRPQPDGSWQMRLWQGASLDGPREGFAFLGRLVPDPAFKRLSGTWQSLPGSCCPGRGRGEIEVLGPDSFRFAVFAPSLERQAWEVLPQAEFHRVAELPPQAGGSHLAGSWRVFLYYNDLLPGGAPADQVQGNLTLQPKDQGAAGSWQGWPGQVELAPTPTGAKLAYRDPAAGYQLEAALASDDGGLSYQGEFTSTLGRGRLRLVRAGLPANPPGLSLKSEGDLSGVWVDPRTGSDYFEITGSAQGFDFTAYGGLPTQPRYLTKGRARPVGPGLFRAEAKDVAGFCCGNQGRLIFRRLGPDRLEVRALWWPQEQPDPGGEPGEPYVIQRVRKKTAPQATAARAGTGGRWPVVQPARPGLLDTQGGAVAVRFVWHPEPDAQHDYTLFSQGGYLRDLDLFIDPQGRLAARIACQDQTIQLRASDPLTPNQPHQAWLTYQAGGQAAIYLDGEKLAELAMPAPWRGSHSPYILGASRWPGRGFSGDIEKVELWDAWQDPENPAPATLSIVPPPATQGQTAGGGEEPLTRPLLRLWNPRRLVHAYAAGFEQAALLKPQGFVLEGPVGRLAARQEEGTTGLYAFRHRAGGYTILKTDPQAPAGTDALGILGYVWTRAADDTTALYQCQGELAEPLRGGTTRDLLYSSRPETLAAAQEAGYGKPKLVCYLRPAKEPDFKPPVLYTWSGAYQGEGWGRFFLLRRGEELFMFWYYGRISGPHYYGRYRLSADGRHAQGVAVGRPGPKATYYRQRLEFDLEAPRGPRIKVTSWRLAAPLDDGRLVSFKNPAAQKTLLIKTAQALPQTERQVLENDLLRPNLDPARLLEEAIHKARQQGRLLERE